MTQFLGIEDSPGARASTRGARGPVAHGSEDEAPDDSDVGSDDEQPSETAKKSKGGGDEPVGVVETTFGKELAKGIRARKTEAPGLLPDRARAGSDYDQKPRVYKINGTGDGAPPNSERAAYKWVFSRPALGEYYGFMATRWQDPPILKNPDDEQGDRRPRPTSSSTTATACGWSPGRTTRARSGSPTPSSSRSPTDEMLEIAKGMTELPKAGADRAGSSD